MTRAPAPGSLALVQRFVNADDPGDARARELREAIRALAAAHNGEPADAGATATLNRAAERAGLRPVLGDDGTLRIEPSAGGLDGELGRVVAAVHMAVADGTWERVKTCERDSCRWLFYDHSKNRSGRWCSMGACGNKEKSARAYRRRQKSPVRPSDANSA